ncbi:TPA: hypothetical protein KKL65_004524 [Escherichia coli]|nr:hypothetical protein [Escherichia coli]
MNIELESVNADFLDTRTIEEQVQDFIKAEMQQLEQQQLRTDSLNKARAVAKRDYLAGCKRHLCGHAVNVMATAEQLIREGWKVDLQTFQALNGYIDMYLIPNDAQLKQGIRRAQREAVASLKLRHETAMKLALEQIKERAAALYDKLTVEQAIAEQHRRRDEIISKLVLGGR